MGDPLPPDPYIALGLTRDATDGQIKSAYRKLALKCHPDKVPDKGDEFHKISQAYELLADEDRKRRYDDDMKFLDLKRAGAGGRRPSNTSYRTRTAERPQASYDDEVRFREGIFDPSDLNRVSSARKYDDVDKPRRSSAPNAPRAKEATRKTERSNTVRGEKWKDSNDRKKQRDRETQRTRSAKYADERGDSEDSEEAGRGVRERVRSGASRMASRVNEEIRHAMRSADEDDPYQKMHAKMNSQRDYVSQANGRDFGSGAAPPPPPRPSNNSSTNIDSDSGVRRSDRSSRATGFVRSRRTSSAARGTPSPEPPTERGSRRPPAFHSSVSSPENIKIPSSRDHPPSSARRAKTFDQHDFEVPPPASLGRSSTMPTQPERRGSVRRGSANPSHGSNLRQVEINDSGYSTSSPQDSPSPDKLFPTSSSTRYKYADKDSGPEMINIERSSRRSPENLERPPLNRGSSASQKYTPADIAGAPPPPPPASGSRRPSISRADSFGNQRSTSYSTQGQSQSRRTQSYSASPASQIPPMKTGRDLPPGTSLGDEKFYFGEQVRTTSPISTDFPPPPIGQFAPASARRKAENVNYARQATSEDVRYTPSFSRRTSEQATGSRLREEAARMYMKRAEMESSERENSSFSYYDTSIPLRGEGMRRGIRREQTTA